MKIDAVNSQAILQAKFEALRLQASATSDISPAANSDGSFSDVMHQTIQSINSQQNLASDMMSAVDSGRSDDLVGAMVASQKAGLSFATLMQVRNKLMTGLDDIMRLPL